MLETVAHFIRRIGTSVATIALVAVVMVAFGLGESLLGKLFGGSLIVGLVLLRIFGSNALENKVGAIVDDKAESIFGSIGAAHAANEKFDADEAFANYMRKRDAGLTEPPPPDVGAIRSFGRKGQ